MAGTDPKRSGKPRGTRPSEEVQDLHEKPVGESRERPASGTNSEFPEGKATETHTTEGEAESPVPENDGGTQESWIVDEKEKPPPREDAPPRKPTPAEDLGNFKARHDIDVDASNAKIDGDLHAIGEQVNNNYYYSGIEGIRRLGVEDFEELSEERLFQLKREMVWDPEDLDALSEVLEEKRILLLAGDPELGKGTLAQLLASELQERPPDERPTGALLLRNPPRDQQVDPLRLTRGEPAFHRRVIIFLDTFATTNRSLLGFLDKLADGIEACTTELAEYGSFLIFTATAVPAHEERLRSCGVLRSAPFPSKEVLLEGLRRCAFRVAAGRCLQKSDVETLLVQEGTKIIRELPTLPLLARFVDMSLKRIVEGQLGVQEAIERVRDLGRSLLVDQSEDLEVWCAAASLTLCSAAPLPTPVPWIQFEGVRTAVFRMVGRALDADDTERSLGQMAQTEEVLRRIGARYVPAVFPRPAGIRFRDETQRDRLWRSVLGTGCSIAALIQPWLDRVLDDGDSELREVAARAVGRIGQLDPFGMVVPRLHKAFDNRSILDLGWLFQGILGSSDEHYRDGCTSTLRKVLDGEQELDTESGSKVGAATVALPLIAVVDQKLAVELWGAVVRKHLEVGWNSLREMNREIRTLKVRHASAWTREQRRELDEVAAALLRDRTVDAPALPILLGTRISLWQLVVWAQDLQQLLASLIELMDEKETSESEPSGPLISLLFLHDWKEIRSLEVGEGGNWGAPELRLLEVAAASPETAAVLCRFTEGLYTHLRPFPGIFRILLERGFVQLLARWARRAEEEDEIESLLVRLLQELFDSDEGKLADLILRLAQSEHPREERRPLCEMARKAVIGA